MGVVFLWTCAEVTPLKLQASEVAAAFWVPLASLLAKENRIHHPVDVSDRMAGQNSKKLRTFFRWMFGEMYFSAIRLQPSSIQKSEVGKDIAKDDSAKMISSDDLILWGITYGVLAVMLDALPPHDFIESFDLPSFKSLDYIFMVRFFSKTHIARQRLQILQPRTSRLSTSKEVYNYQPSAVELLIRGYYRFARRAVFWVLILRLLFIIVALYVLVVSLIPKVYSMSHITEVRQMSDL
jgi:hypothetical protein